MCRPQFVQYPRIRQAGCRRKFLQLIVILVKIRFNKFSTHTVLAYSLIQISGHLITKCSEARRNPHDFTSNNRNYRRSVRMTNFHTCISRITIFFFFKISVNRVKLCIVCITKLFTILQDFYFHLCKISIKMNHRKLY